MNSHSEKRARISTGYRVLFFFILLVAIFSTGMSIDGQEPGAIISVDVRLVVLHASVRDKKGALVPGLAKEQFRVEEDGRPQIIKLFQHEDLPVAVGLVVDNSGSMRRKRVDAAKAVVAFARASNSGDEMFIVNFNDDVTFGIRDAELRSTSEVQLEQALLAVPSTGRTALYDAVGSALEHIQKSRKERKALVVISDGGDNISQRTLNQVLEAAERSDAIIYTIGLFDQDDPDRKPGVLKKIAASSGGEAFVLETASALTPICERIAEAIRTQYTIGYSPTNPALDGSYRKISVRLTGPSTSGMHVRVRPGYVASREGISAVEGETSPREKDKR